MADVTYIYENLLPERTPVAVNDFIRVIGSDNASYKALVSNLAKCIVENYAGSSLAGADKSIQNAINEINTKVDLADGGLAIATSASAMTNQDLIYVYTGNETGYTYGDWYFWNGSAWTSGGEVGSIVPDASLSQEGRAADAKVTGDTLAEKADKDGVIATAEGLIGGAYTLEKEPYHFRKTAVDLAGRLDETIVGGSLGWNQLVQDGNFTSTNKWSAMGGTYTVANNIATVSITADSGTVKQLYQTYNFIENHKMLGIVSVKPSKATQTCFRIDTSSNNPLYECPANVWTTITNIKNMRTQANADVNIYDMKSLSSGDTVQVKNAQMLDLTLLFGTTIADYIYSLEQATAGAGVAWVKRYIDLDTYHEYDAGSIQSVEGLVSHDVVGFNAWDEEWEVGSYNPTTGEKDANHASWRNKNPIPIIPNTQYYFYTNSAQSAGARAFWYDADGNYMSFSYGFNALVTPPSKARFLNIRIEETHTSDTKLCINLSDPSRNGTYEPYEKHSYPLDSDVVLRGVPKLVTDHIEFDGDKYHADGSVERRYGVVVLNGTENWNGTAENGYYVPLYSLKKINDVGGYVGHMLADKVPIGTWNVEGALQGYYDSTNRYPDQNWLYYRDQTLSLSDVKSYFTSHPTTVVYELATPTTETAQPFQSPMIVGATEEYISDSVVPVGHESKYYEDVAKKVNGLPKDFSTLIAPTEVTFTATRNYSVGSYLIVKNQLYKVTSAISSGGTITPNSNVTATTIMAEILALA